MKLIKRTRLAAAIGTAALAGALCAPANAAIVLGGDNGWEVSYGGFINLFYTQSDFEFEGGASEDSSHLNEGLLPAFHTLTAKSPEIGGLKGTAQITFAPDSSTDKRKRLNKSGVLDGGSEIDMREVFFNVSGDFGTISAGRTLSLYQRQAILKDMTLFGMGALAGPDGGGTGLGRIGFGYVYPDFRTRFTYKTPDINGFNLEVGIFDPQEPIGVASNTAETDTPQFQTEATYTHGFEGGSFNVWFGLLWQEEEITSSAAGGTGDIESFGWNVGLDVKFGGFNVVGHYYDGEALGTLLFNLGPNTLDGSACSVTDCDEADNNGGYIQGSYTFNGKTKVGVSWGGSFQDDNTAGAPEIDNELWTVGVYHDVNSWLKVVAEYNEHNSDFLGHDTESFSVGAFVLW
ncbi:MAG: porin [Gammaproteobacteria bacterium]|nr:porin [Gammaproteobacteria bacterium]